MDYKYYTVAADPNAVIDPQCDIYIYYICPHGATIFIFTFIRFVQIIFLTFP